MEGAYFTDGMFQCYNSFFGYTLFRVLSFGQKLNMTLQDFHKIQYGRNFTADLFQIWLIIGIMKDIRFSLKPVQNAHKLRLCYSELIHSFYKPNSFIHVVCSAVPFNAIFAFQNCLLWIAETKGQTCIQEN